MKKSSLADTTRSTVKEALDFGFIPIPLEGKKPIAYKWPDITRETCQSAFDKVNWEVNVGILTGEKSGIVVVDVDTQNRGLEVWREMIDKHHNGISPVTPCVETGSGGYHFYFLFEPRTAHLKSHGTVFGDTKTTGGQVVYPGSIYPGCGAKHKCGSTTDADCKYKGRPYTWVISPETTKIAPMPAWLLEILTPKVISPQQVLPSNKLTTEDEQMAARLNVGSYGPDRISTLEEIQEAVNLLSDERADSRTSWLHTVWCLKKLSLNYIDIARKFSRRSSKYSDEAFNAAWKEGKGADGPWGMNSLIRWVQHDATREASLAFMTKYNRGTKHESLLNMDYAKADRGLANLYLQYYNDCLKITHENGSGYLWNRQRNMFEKSGYTRCKHSVEVVLSVVIEDTIEVTKDKEDKERLSHILKNKVYSSAGLTGVFNFIRGDIIDALFEDKINVSHPDLLPIKNGNVIDLRTREVRRRTKTDLFSHECDRVEYLGDDHPCPLATRFFNQIFINKPDLIEFAMRLFGYSMTGLTTEKGFYFLWGKGNNGKTTLIEMMRDILGEFYTPIDKEVLLKQRFSKGRDAATPGLRLLRGCRLCSTSETSADQELDEPMIKLLTGGDTFVARGLHENPVKITCVAKLMMLTNDPPAYNPNAKAMGIRVKMLPFLGTAYRKDDKDATKFDAEEMSRRFLIDEAFINELKTTGLSEVFTLLVRGVSRWYAEKTLTYPQICIDELDRHNEEHDFVAMFIAECCLVNQDYKVNIGAFHKALVKWFADTKQHGACPSVSTMRDSMGAKGYPIRKHDTKKYIGIMLK